MVSSSSKNGELTVAAQERLTGRCQLPNKRRRKVRTGLGGGGGGCSGSAGAHCQVSAADKAASSPAMGVGGASPTPAVRAAQSMVAWMSPGVWLPGYLRNVNVTRSPSHAAASADQNVSVNESTTLRSARSMIVGVPTQH